MLRLLVPLLCVAEVLLAAGDPPPLSQGSLKTLSDAGEECVVGEIRRALLRVKQAKAMMEVKEEKHRRLMDALRHSGDKTKGATQLANETQQRLKDAERQCRHSTKPPFEECRPCLEDACKNFYTSTCRRGFTSFSLKVEEFFRKTASQPEGTEHVHAQREENAGVTGPAQVHLTEDKADKELLQEDASLSRLLSNISLLYNQSVLLGERIQAVLGRSLAVDFAAEPQPAEQSDPAAGFIRTAGPDQVLGSLYDFGSKMLEDLGSAAAETREEAGAEDHVQRPGGDTGPPPGSRESRSRHLCRRLRRQASECWQLQDVCKTCEDYLLKECPGVQQLHTEMEEMHMLLSAARQRYEERLQLVRRHTADARRWLGDVRDKYSWIGRLPSSAGGPRSIFSVITVNPQQQTHNKADSSVVVTVLDSAPIVVSVPADLKVDEPVFIQYIAQEALRLHKGGSDAGLIEAECSN